MRHIIGLAGYAQVGKDSVAEVLKDAYGFSPVAFADGVRDLAVELNPLVFTNDTHRALRYNDALAVMGYEGMKANTDARDWLVKIGAGARAVFGPDIWVEPVAHKIRESVEMERMVITDVRYANEAEMIEGVGGEVWGITREGVGPANEEEERTLALITPHRIIRNDDSLEILRGRVLDAAIRAFRRADYSWK